MNEVFGEHPDIVAYETEHKPYYGGKEDPYEAIKVIEAWRLNFNLGNCIKYISRAGKKTRDTMEEDLQKCMWYLDRELKRIQGKTP